MRDALIHRCLLLEEEVHVILLERERQRKVLDCERHLRGVVVEPQQIDLADNRLDAAFELTDTLLLTREVFNDVRDDFLTEAKFLKEIDFTKGGGDEVRLRNDDLLLETEAIHLDVVHAVAQNWVDLLMIVMREDEQAAAQIEVDAREVFVLEAVVLAAVRQVDEQIVDLLALRRLRDLV